MKSAIQNDVALGIFYQFTRCHRIGHGNTLCKLKETRVFGGFWRTAFVGLKKRWIMLIYLIITEIKVIFVMEGRGSYRAREAHRPASLAGYNKIWCAVPPSCRGAAAPLFYAQTLLLPSMQRWCMACCWTTTLRLSVWQGTGQHTLLKPAKKGWQQTGQMPAVAIAPFLFIAVCRLSFLRAWDSQASLVPRVIEAVVGIVKFERIMFGHDNVVTVYWS